MGGSLLVGLGGRVVLGLLALVREGVTSSLDPVVLLADVKDEAWIAC